MNLLVDERSLNHYEEGVHETEHVTARDPLNQSKRNFTTKSVAKCDGPFPIGIFHWMIPKSIDYCPAERVAMVLSNIMKRQLR